MPEFLKTKGDFDKALADADGKLVAVDFTASWCPPCKMIGPVFEALSKDEKYKDVLFFKVDVDENDETAQAEGISAMPTFKFYRNGKEVAKFTGASESKLKENLDKLM